MSARQYAYFEELPLKTEFNLNGERWVKRSARMAIIQDCGHETYHFKPKELYVVGIYSRLSADYFDEGSKDESNHN